MANQRPVESTSRTEFTVKTSKDMANAERTLEGEALQHQACAVVRGAIDTGTMARQRPPLQLVTREVAARLAGVSVAEVNRWHSTGTGPRAYRVAGCWVYRAREVELFIRARGRGSGNGGARVQ
jgi:hypothetical protein